eukprot:3767249-Pyramimonas_sp.AAC.1
MGGSIPNNPGTVAGWAEGHVNCVRVRTHHTRCGPPRQNFALDPQSVLALTGAHADMKGINEHSGPMSVRVWVPEFLFRSNMSSRFRSASRFPNPFWGSRYSRVELAAE